MKTLILASVLCLSTLSSAMAADVLVSCTGNGFDFEVTSSKDARSGAVQYAIEGSETLHGRGGSYYSHGLGTVGKLTRTVGSGAAKPVTFSDGKFALTLNPSERVRDTKLIRGQIDGTFNSYAQTAKSFDRQQLSCEVYRQF